MPTALDLSNAASYVDSVDWVRRHVVLKNTIQGPVLQLDVSLPPSGAVTLFMNPKNHYIMGFRGADKIYILNDKDSPQFLKDVKSQFSGSQAVLLKGISVSHAATGLGTFTGKGNQIQGAIFKREDLHRAAILSTYTQKGSLQYADLKRSLSLLVCMISESARIPMMERDFARMYNGYPVVADSAIRSFDDARYLMRMAAGIFPQYPNAAGVEKLDKRATELDELLERVRSITHAAGGKTLVAQILTGRPPIADPAAQPSLTRFRDMARELKLTDPGDITQLISTCKSEPAVRAAKQGVTIAPVGL